MEPNLHTFVVSDMHLTEAEEPDPARPLWMAYKRREFFIDDEFAKFLDHIEQKADGPIELILNGDIFDFDSVTAVPSKDRHVEWLERSRGLGSEEWKSQFKMKVIIDDHPRWFEALGAFIARGNRAVFIVGNHDVEIYWPSVQRMICDALSAALPSNIGEEEDDDPIVFCNWFYLSGGDTYVSHGHQYDPNCVVRDPIDPLVEVNGQPRVRIPFGDLAARYMLNGMGYFNPHQSENYIMSGTAYVRFFFRYMLRTQPLLIWTWVWGAYVTLWISLRTHWLPAMRDPMLVDDKVRSIAARAQATPSMVRKLNVLHVPSATNNPFRIARELWLDRAFFLLVALFLAWQVVLHINIALPISPLWVFVPALDLHASLRGLCFFSSGDRLRNAASHADSCRADLQDHRRGSRGFRTHPRAQMRASGSDHALQRRVLVPGVCRPGVHDPPWGADLRLDSPRGRRVGPGRGALRMEGCRRDADAFDLL